MRRTVPGFLLALLGGAALPSPLAPPLVTAAAAEVPRDGEAYESDYGRFCERLGAFLVGEEETLGDLREAAATLATRHGRDDAPRVVEYYAGLTAEQRGEGRAREAQFLGFWEEVEGAKEEGWPEARPEILERLEAFTTETIGEADFVPAARALSLSALIVARQLRPLGPVAGSQRQGLVEAAIRDAREALSLFERAGQLKPSLEPLHTLGQLEMLRGREQEAWDWFGECSRTAIHTRHPQYRELAIVGMIELARQEGDVLRVKDLVDELSTFRRPEECWPLAREHASVLIHADEAERAEKLLLHVRPEDPDELRAWRLMLAISRQRQHDTAGARELLEAIGEDEWGEDELLEVARVELLEGRTADVIERFAPGGIIEDFEPRGQQNALTLLGEALHREGDDTGALDVLENAREIGERWEAQLAAHYPLEATTASVMGEWQGLHTAALEARVRARLGRPLEAALLIERVQGAGGRRDGGSPLSIDELLEWAASFEHGLVTWIVGAECGLAVHVDANGNATALEFDHPRTALQRAVRRLREALLLDDQNAVDALSNELSAALLPEELRERLRAGDGTGRLLCLAHGPIEALPLEALRVGGRPLDELATTLVLPLLVASGPGDAPELGDTWRLLGDPLDDAGRACLPAAGSELAEVASIVGAATLESRERFTREVVLDALEEGAPLHLVTHLLEGDCEGVRYPSVGLLLSAGEVLCAQEIAEHGSRTPLVVLAACETSGGRFVDAVGQVGLARAFLDGGARDLLVTLWPIEDEAARRFTPLFHLGLEDGLTPSRAAREARRALADQGEKVADWAAFRVVGRD